MWLRCSHLVVEVGHIVWWLYIIHVHHSSNVCVWGGEEVD